MELPYDPEGRYKLVDKGATLRVTDISSCSEISTTQFYRIYNYKRNTKSLTVIAFPKAMESTFDAPISQIIMNSDVTGISAASTLNGVSQKYTVQSDVEATGRAVWTNTNLNKAIAGSDENSFINVWGGEVVYDNTTIKILEQLGDDSDPAVVMYGKNISEISYEVDDSGMMTRIYPLSKDGIRYNDNGTEYIDSDKILDYPIVHANYAETPYKLIEDDASSVSRTAQKTADIKQRIQTKASQLSHSIWNTAVSNGWKIDYLASIYKDIIENIQNMVTANYIHDDFIKVVKAAVQAGMEWMSEQEDPEWVWEQVGTDAWKYGSSVSGRYARNEWQYIDKKWRYFGDDYLWQEPADDDSTWTWYESKTTHKLWYGTQDRYYLKGQYIYYTDPDTGEFTKFWLDGDGWYDADKKDTSDYAWHQDSEVGGAWFFGTVDDDGYRDKYISGQWVFIEGSLYWFDSNGYYYGEKKDTPQYDWMQSGEAWWFGNPDHAYDSIWLKSQWAKIDRQWYRFDSDGYTEDIHTQALSMFHSGMNDLTTLVTTCNSECYALLFDLMEEWTEKQYADGVDVPTVTINVDMVDLSKTVEYKNYQQLEQIHLGDSVKCLDYVHAIASLERVVELTYDVLRGYNTAITIGVANSSVGSMLSGSTGGGSGSGYNSAINVEVIEQNISEKNPILRAGKNTTITDNVDGTQTIASDKLIRAGENVQVQHNSDGSDTISAEGGALEYWVETEPDLYRRKQGQVNNEWGWICDDEYLVEENDSDDDWQLLTANQMEWGYFNFFKNMHTENSRCCVGICRVKDENNKWRFAFVSISGQDITMAHQYYSGDLSTYPFTYNGITLYSSWGYMGTDNYDSREHEWSEVLSQTGAKTLLDFGTYDSIADAQVGLINASNFYCAQVQYTGESVGNISAWGGEVKLIGNPDSISKTDMPWYITKDGIVNSKGYKINNVDLYNIFQQILIAGNNIQIGEDGKTISATDTTYTAGTNVQISGQNVISATDTTYTAGDNISIDANNEISATDTDAIADMTDVDIDEQTLANGNVLKWNSTSEKWENGTGGGGSANAQEITWANYQALSQAEKENGTIYYIPDAPDSMAMPYLTMENGVPTLVFDDGE